MELNTIEKFLLLAQHPIKGRFVISDMHINYGIVGAALMEMSINDQIKIENNKLILNSTKKSDDPIISDISTIIKNSRKIRKISYWITKLARKSRKYRLIVLTDLEKKRCIRIEHRKFLGLFSYKKTYLIDRRTRDNLIRTLRNNISIARELNDDDMVVLGLVEACKMHRIITTDRAELKRIRKELKQVLKESPIASTVDVTIKQMQAAIVGAIIASTVVTTSTSS